MKNLLPSVRISTAVDVGIKLVGVLIGVTVFPMAIMISVMAAMVFLIVWRTVTERKDPASPIDE